MTRLRPGPHPYIAENEAVDAGGWVRSVVSPLEILEGNANAFVRHYYRLVDRVDVDVGVLSAVYRDGSCLTTAQGDQIRGGASIAACVSRRAAAGAGGLIRDVASLDVLPGGVEGGMLVMATGTLRGGVGMGEGGVGGSHGDARRMDGGGSGRWGRRRGRGTFFVCGDVFGVSGARGLVSCRGGGGRVDRVGWDRSVLREEPDRALVASRRRVPGVKVSGFDLLTVIR